MRTESKLFSKPQWHMRSCLPFRQHLLQGRLYRGRLQRSCGMSKRFDLLSRRRQRCRLLLQSLDCHTHLVCCCAGCWMQPLTHLSLLSLPPSHSPTVVPVQTLVMGVGASAAMDSAKFCLLLEMMPKTGQSPLPSCLFG